MRGRRFTGSLICCALCGLLSACQGGGTADLSQATAHTPEAPPEPPAEEPGDDPVAAGGEAEPSARQDPPDLEGAARTDPDPPQPSSPEAPEGSVRRRFPPVAGRALRAVPPAQICVTLGAVRPAAAGLLVDDSKLRATLAGSGGNAIELTFRYLGPTAQIARLRSGNERHQLGIELSARDTCNLLYVMWHIEPSSELVVQVKRNGSQSTHVECENRGYHRLRPTVSAPVPKLTPGTEHQLHAEITEGELSVHVDGSLVWSGPLDDDAIELTGKSGLRSDNARFELLELLADERADALTVCPAR